MDRGNFDLEIDGNSKNYTTKCMLKIPYVYRISSDASDIVEHASLWKFIDINIGFLSRNH